MHGEPRGNLMKNMLVNVFQRQTRFFVKKNSPKGGLKTFSRNSGHMEEEAGGVKI